MTALTPEELERRARTATPSELNVWLHDSRREVRAVAAAEQKRRSDERHNTNALTGVIDPLGKT